MTINLFKSHQHILHKIAFGLVRDGVLPETLKEKWEFLNITVEPPKQSQHGDMASNLALLLARPLAMKPHEIAEKFKAELTKQPHIVEVTIAGPGFLNWRIDHNLWRTQIGHILEQGLSYGKSDMGNGELVNIEYVSTNPTGPLHVGHARGAVIGDALAGLLEMAGYQVLREFYVNDAGQQIDKLAHSLYLRYIEALEGEEASIPEDHYPGDYLIAPAQKLVAEEGAGLKAMEETERLVFLRQFAVKEMLKLIRHDLSLLGIHHDVFSSEAKLVSDGRIEEMLKNLKHQGLIYQGVLEPPKGKKRPDDWEPREQMLFKSTSFGDDMDRPLQKSDGSWTYFASDIAYHYDKLQRGYHYQIDVLGADHGGYVKRVQAALKAVSQGKGQLDVLLCQIVKFMKNGKPLRMSKRAGSYVALEDLIQAVGKDVVRFYMLSRKSDAQLDFDLELVTTESKENPVFYVQYAHARAASVLREGERLYGKEKMLSASLKSVALEALQDEGEMQLIRYLGQWPRIIEAASEAREPHRITYYLQELAGHFHSLWNKGKDHHHLRFINPEDEAETMARLALVMALKTVISNGLNLLQITAKEQL